QHFELVVFFGGQGELRILTLTLGEASNPSRWGAFSAPCPRTSPTFAAPALSTAGATLRGFAQLGEDLVALVGGKVLHLLSAHRLVDSLLESGRNLLHHAGDPGRPLIFADASAACAAAARSTRSSAGGVGWRAFRRSRTASRSSAGHTPWAAPSRHSARSAARHASRTCRSEAHLLRRGLLRIAGGRFEHLLHLVGLRAQAGHQLLHVYGEQHVKLLGRISAERIGCRRPAHALDLAVERLVRDGVQHELYFLSLAKIGAIELP